MTGPQATVTRERAIGAAVAIAEAHAIRVEHPIVLRDRSNLLVQLAPAPIVARVAAATATMRRGTAWLSREVDSMPAEGYANVPRHAAWEIDDLIPDLVPARLQVGLPELKHLRG